MRAGLAYVRGRPPRRVYVLKDLEGQERIKVRLPEDMTKESVAGEWAEKEIEVLDARG